MTKALTSLRLVKAFAFSILMVKKKMEIQTSNQTPSLSVYLLPD